MSTYFLRNTTESPNLLKRILGAVLPLSLKRHLLYLKHYRRLGNFRNPRLFSEKVQWRIINDRREILRHTCDKRASKRLAQDVAAKSGIEVRVPEQLAWGATSESFLAQLRSAHDAGRLPRRWVMKPNHSSGRALAVDGEPDWSIVETAARAWMAPSRFSGLHWIWPYDAAEPGLLAEAFIPGEHPPLEWQLWLFDGVIAYTVAQQRIGSKPHRTIFDREWNRVEPWYHRDAAPLEVSVPPANWQSIERAALALGAGWDLIRVDLFEDDRGQVWFSEFTPFPSEGLFSTRTGTDAFDASAGAAWVLPTLSADGRA